MVITPDRAESNAVFHVRKVITDNTKKKNAKGVIKEQCVSLTYKAPDGTQKKLELRRITFKADNGKVYYRPAKWHSSTNTGG